MLSKGELGSDLRPNLRWVVRKCTDPIGKNGNQRHAKGNQKHPKSKIKKGEERASARASERERERERERENALQRVSLQERRLFYSGGGWFLHYSEAQPAKTPSKAEPHVFPSKTNLSVEVI